MFFTIPTTEISQGQDLSAQVMKRYKMIFGKHKFISSELRAQSVCLY